MPLIDPRVDSYIERSADFAQPILTHLRELVHKACPDVTETIKWGMPSFEYKGMMCGIASFKAHCTFGFWKQKLLESDAFPASKTAMGSFGRITSLKDLPKDKVIIGIIHQAMELNDKGINVPKTKNGSRSGKEVVIPDVLAAALKKDKAARETFEKFPPSCRREYIEWITEAKTDATREKRLATTLEWLAEGKRRNWKYEKC
ncbi:MAG: YdeI/OmpD-associated family protein [Acidobacteria bacterium]|nr:YdeI/OmpD-associated family protein [Acidobacteriota bacterium]